MNYQVIPYIYIALSLLLMTKCPVLYKRFRSEGNTTAAAAFFLPVAAIVIIWTQGAAAYLHGYDLWSSARLAPVFSIPLGYSLYYGPETGPILNLIYPPMAALIYLPILLLASLPINWIVFSAATLGSILILVPSYLFHRKISGDRTAAVFAFLLFSTWSTYNIFPDVHADVPAVFFGALSCYVLFFYGSRPKFLLVSALLTVLSIYSKQTMLPLLVTLPLYTAFAQGRRLALYHFGFLLAGFLSFGILWGGLFGFSELFFNCWTVPINHPWKANPANFDRELIYGTAIALRLKSLAAAARFLIEEIALYGGMILFYVLSELTQKEAKFNFKKSLPLFLFWVALSLVPSALLNRVKVGAGWNSYYIVIYYASLSAFTGILVLAQSKNETFRSQIRMAILAFSISLLLFTKLTHAPHTFSRNAANSNVMSYGFIKQYPGQVYFPWHPLPHLLTEKKLYHYQYGVIDREYANFVPSDKHIRAYTPSGLWAVGFCMDEDTSLMKYLPEYSEKITLPEMPGWLFYVKPGQKKPHV